MKTCSRCKKKLSIEAFGRHRLHRDGLQSICRECKTKQDREYYKQNKAQKAKYDRKRRQNETEESRDRRNERRRELYAANPKVRAKHNKQWKQSNPEKVKLQVQCRRARIKRAHGEFSIEDWEDIKNIFDNLCAYCGQPKSLTVDHIIPLSKGGQHDRHNIVPACINCNSQKHVSTSGWPIMTGRRDIVKFYGKTLEDAKQMAIDFAEGIS